MRDSGRTVKALDNAPEVGPDIALLLRCYFDLNADRNSNGTIPFSAVARWFEVFGLPLADAWEVIRYADAGVKEWLSARSKK